MLVLNVRATELRRRMIKSLKMNDRIAIDPAVLVGKPVTKGTRLAVEFIVGLLAGGWTFDDILQEYDHISRPTTFALASRTHISF
jgi:uncharacterized protein (DUF433 family)